MKIHDDIGQAVDQGKGALVLFLDMSAAFDTVDATILTEILHTHIGLEGHALSWFLSYMTGRSHRVKVGNETSEEVPLQHGVPQGSVLGPVLFSVYGHPMRTIFKRHGVLYHKYADDTTLYTFYNPAIPGDLEAARARLIACFNEVRAWLLTHFLQLNAAKTEFLCILSQNHLAKYGCEAIRLGGVPVKAAASVRALGAMLDTHLNMTAQVNSVICRCNHYIRQIGRIRKNITTKACHAAIQSLVISKLDYCNVLLTAVPQYQLDRLETVHKRAARLIKRADMYCHITQHLYELHWLPIGQRVKFKVLLYVFKALNGLAPSYIADLIKTYIPGRSLRSASAGPLLVVPPSKRVIGDRTFSRQAPQLWNALPKDIRLSQNKLEFKRRLKTHLFQEHYGQLPHF